MQQKNELHFFCVPRSLRPTGGVFEAVALLWREERTLERAQVSEWRLRKKTLIFVGSPFLV